MIRLLSLLSLIVPMALSAQIAIHPQIGMALTTLTPEQEGVRYNADVGVLAGADLRIGQRFYIQPGAFFVSAKTAVSLGDSVVTEDQLVWNSLKLKALAAYNLVDGDDFRLRLNAGPTYNWLLTADGKDEAAGPRRLGTGMKGKSLRGTRLAEQTKPVEGAELLDDAHSIPVDIDALGDDAAEFFDD